MASALRAMGSGVPALLALVLGCWMFLLRSISIWIGKTPVVGQETGKIMQQVYSGAVAVGIWILLGGLLLLANVKGVLPGRIGLASWILLPVTCFMALLAIAVMYDPGWRWMAAIPVFMPVLIAGYALYLFFPPAHVLSPVTAGLITWGAALVLGLVSVPEAIRVADALLNDGSIEAKPGPAMDRWLAEQRAKRRVDGMAVLKRVDEETEVGDLEYLTRSDSPVRSEALEAMRHFPNRQSQAEQALQIRLLVDTAAVTRYRYQGHPGALRGGPPLPAAIREGRPATAFGIQ
jgi:hypothetical protein